MTIACALYTSSIRRWIDSFQSRVFFPTKYTDVDNRERATTRDKNKGDDLVGKKTSKFYSGGEEMRNASGNQGGNERQWEKMQTERHRTFRP